MHQPSTIKMSETFIEQTAHRLQTSGWDVKIGPTVIQLLRVVGSFLQRGELRRTPLGGWDLYQRVMPVNRMLALPSVALLACPRLEDFSWTNASHALDSCLHAAML